MRTLALLALPLLAACPPPRDSGYVPPVPVVGGAAQRADLFPSRRRDRAAPSGPARVHRMKKGEELAGPNAIGRPGDLVLENDEVVFVIDQLGSSAGFAESGGNIVDAADARTRKDEIGQVFTYFGTFPRQGVYDTLDAATMPDGSAIVTASGRELYEPKLEVKTTYTLTKNDRAVVIETALTNRGDRPVEKLSLGDAIQWGGAEKFSPGKPLGFKGPSSGPFMGGLGRHASYAVAATEGDVDAISGSSWTDTIQKKDVTVAPGERVTYSRVFLVGERPDAASLIAELTKIAGGQVGALEIALTDAAGKAVAAPPGGKVVIGTPSGGAVMSIVTPTGDPFGGELPPGKYVAWYASGGGRKGAGAKVPIEITAGKATQVSLAVSGAGGVKIACAELALGADGRKNRVAGPCKASFEGLDGTPAPEFGSPHVAGPARSQVTSATGTIEVPLAPGKYKVTLSRGPEYTIAQREVTVPDGPAVDACDPVDRCVLERVVDTKGYLATDLHQHTMLGADAPVSTRDRVVSNVAEGVEVAVASEHNYVADLGPVIREMGLQAKLVSIPGNEVTTDALKKPWGHVNAFPLVPEPSRPRAGAVTVREKDRDRPANEVLEALRALPGSPIVQVNHPRTKITGYFDQLGFDAKTGVGKDPTYDPKFDALEVWNGRNVDERDRVLGDYFALLATSHPVTMTANTDTHGIVGQEAGYPRTYVRVANDAELDRWDAARSGDLVKALRVARDVVLTNGPFLRVTANNTPVGAVARAKKGAVEVAVHVECAPWIDVDTVEVVHAVPDAVDAPKDARTPPSPAPSDAAKIALKALSSGARGADVTLTMRVKKDDAIVVKVTGKTPMRPVLDGDAKEITPFAMTGAIWIDADGDGKALGR
jgi:hypothetical protein